MNEDYKKLTETVRRLNGLLQDPQPGLFMWQGMFHERLQELAEQLKDFGY